MEFCEVETASGRVQGLISSGIRQFKGVPYGAPTSGANRFRRPQPPTPWSRTRECFGYGPVSPQLPYDINHQYARLIQFDLNVAVGGMGEDCLQLNIWTPGTGRQDKRAVLFCIHGGGFAICSGNHPMYDGAKLASAGDVVVVSVTHRLSSFGYLNLADVDPAGPWGDAGAAGMLDLIAALRWVRDNIEGFGGDPGRVLILGQSGGGWKVSTLLKMPAARGLFHRAVIQSGSLAAHFPREAAAQMAQAFLEKLGVKRASLETIQELPWTQLLAAQSALGAHVFAPFVDGTNIAVQPLEDLASQLPHVPLIIGTTLDDAGLFFDRFDMTEQDLIDALTVGYGPKAAAIHALYREYFPNKSAYLLHAQIITDAGFRRFAHLQADYESQRPQAAVYTYLWEWQSPAYEGKFGAVHAMDVAASMHNERDAILGSGSNDAHRACEELALALVAFAQTGNPNHRRLPHWPQFETRHRSTLVLERDSRVLDDPHAALRKFWLDMPPSASILG